VEGTEGTTPSARLMSCSEASLIIEYFHGATSVFLYGLGIDPARLPLRDVWRAHYDREFELPIEKRKSLLVIWEWSGEPLGFSTADKIVIGEEAFMHVHIIDGRLRRLGYGTLLVRQSAEIYFEALRIRTLFCEPYAFNMAPNRALQKAGFKYLMTHETVPGPLNFYQSVNRWMLSAGHLRGEPPRVRIPPAGAAL
jgi:hypothetical protein